MSGARSRIRPPAASSPLIVVGGTVANVAATALGSVVVIRALPPAEVAAWVLALGMVTIGSQVAQLGMNRSAVRAIGEALARDDRDDALAAGGAAIRVAASAAVVAAVLAVPVALSFLGPVLAAPMAPTILAAGWLAVDTVRLVVTEANRAWGDQRAATLAGNPMRNTLFAFVALALHARGSADILSVLVGALASSAAAGAAGGVLLRRRGRAVHRRSGRSLLAAGVVVGAIAASNQFLNQADVLVAGAVTDSAGTATYGVALRVVAVLGTVQLTANLILSPVLVRLRSQERLAELEALLRTSATAVTAVVAAIVLVLIVSGRTLLGVVFGSFYEDAHLTLLLLAVGLLVRAATGSIGVLLVLSGRERTVLGVLLPGVVLVLAAEMLLGSMVGIEGVAVASGGGVAAIELGLALRGRRVAGVIPWTHVRPRALLADLRMARGLLVEPARPAQEPMS